MSQKRRGGVIYLKVNGERYLAKGSFSYNIGLGKKEGLVGSDEPHGYMEKPQIPFIEGEITDTPELELSAFLSFENATATLELANGKTIVISEAWNASEGTVNTEEGNMPIRIEGMRGEEF